MSWAAMAEGAKFIRLSLRLRPDVLIPFARRAVSAGRCLNSENSGDLIMQDY